MPRILPFVLLIPGLGVGSLAVAEPVNPFSRPADGPVAATGSAEPATLGRPELRGVVVAGPNSIANLNGTLLAIGEAVSGYELAAVSEDSATFLRDGEPITLELASEVSEDDE